MKKTLSPIGLLWISLTSMIGSGWLFGSLYSAHLAGPAAIIAWPFAAFLLLFVALAYAEIGTMFPQANCLARLPFYTHGRLTSAMLSGLAWISLATIPVIETQGIMQYASNYLPSLVHQHNLYYTCTFVGYLFVILILISFVFLNYFGIQLFSRINTLFTAWKLLIPSITIIVLISTSFNIQNFVRYDGFMPYGWQGIMSAMSNGGVLFSLLGFRQVIILMSNFDNPSKYVPIVLISSLIITALLYVGLQSAFIGSLRSQDLVHGWSHLSFPGDAGPFAALTTNAGIMWLSILLYVDAFISPYSTGLIYSTTAANMLSIMGEIKDVPSVVAEKNKYQVPWVSLCINCILAASMFFLLHNWQAMASFLVTALMLSYAVGPICLICLRKQLPTYPRPFRLKFSGLIAFIGFYICTAGVYWAGLISLIKLFVLTMICLSIYLICYLFGKIKHELDIKHSLWLLFYMIGLSIFSYFGNYGGKHFIPLYWDLIYLLVFSLLIFMLAIFLRKTNEHAELQCGNNKLYQ